MRQPPGRELPSHYVESVRGSYLEVECYGRAEYLSVVRERRRREALAQLRTGSHWGAEETGRWARPRVPREQRMCPHCAGGLSTCPILYWIALSIRLCVSSTLTCLLRSTPCSLSCSLPGPWPTLLMPAGNSMQQPPLPSLSPSDVPTLHCILFKLPPIKSCFISVFHVSISWGIPTWPCHDPFINLGTDVFGTSISPEGLCQHVSCG